MDFIHLFHKKAGEEAVFLHLGDQIDGKVNSTIILYVNCIAYVRHDGCFLYSDPVRDLLLCVNSW